MVKRVEEFAYNMIVNVFNSQDTAPLAINGILEVGSYDPGPKGSRIEDPAEWTPEKFIKKAASMTSGKKSKGDFDD